MRQVFDDETIALATRIPKALHRAIRLHALEEDRSLMELVGEALSEHLERCTRATGQKSGRARRKVTATRPKVTLMPRVSGAT